MSVPSQVQLTMSFPSTVFLVAVGVLSVTWRSYAAGISTWTVKQEIGIEWLCWMFIYIGCRVHHCTRRKSHNLPQDQQPQPYDGTWSRELKIYALSAAGVGAQMSRSFGIFPSVLVSMRCSRGNHSLRHLSKAPHHFAGVHIQFPDSRNSRG